MTVLNLSYPRSATHGDPGAAGPQSLFTIPRGTHTRRCNVFGAAPFSPIRHTNRNLKNADACHGNFAAKANIHVAAGVAPPAVVVAVIAVQVAFAAKAQRQRAGIKRAVDPRGIGRVYVEIGKIDVPE